MSLVDKSQAIVANWDPSVDPNIPSWKRELIIKKRAAFRSAGEPKSSTAKANAVGEAEHSCCGGGNEAGKSSSSVQEKRDGGNAHESPPPAAAAVHPSSSSAATSAPPPAITTSNAPAAMANGPLLFHASGNKHKDWNCGAIQSAKVAARSSVDSGRVAGGGGGHQKQRSIATARLTADRAPSGWLNCINNNNEPPPDKGGEFVGSRGRFCGKRPFVGRMVEEKGGGGGGGEFVVVGGKGAETTAMTAAEATDGGGIAAPSPTCSSFSDGFAYCSDSDGGDEYEYGPGIVNRLRSKFINLTVNEMEKERYGLLRRRQPMMRRVASLEHMLDMTTAVATTASSDNSRFNFARGGEEEGEEEGIRGNGGGGARGGFKTNRKKKLDVLKKARSMETLLTPSDTYASQKKIFYYEKPNSSNILFNENVVIIEQQQPKHSESAVFSGPIILKREMLVRRSGNASIEEDELPKPDIVRTYKKIFENSLMNNQSISKTPAHGKFSLVPSVQTTTAKSDTFFSAKSFSAKSWKEEAAIPLKHVDSEFVAISSALPLRNNHGKHENFIEHSNSRTICNGDIVQEDLSKQMLIKDSGDFRVNKTSEALDKFQEKLSARSAHKLKEDDAKPVNIVNELENVTIKSRPRIIDVKSKADEKPVGLIKPLNVSTVPPEQKENFINQMKSTMAKTAPPHTIINGTVEDVTNADQGIKTTLKKAQLTKQQDGNSVVFNFTGKSNVIPNISNTQSSYSIQRPLVKIDNTGKLVSNLFRGGDVSGIVLIPGMTTSVSSDYSDDDDFVDGTATDELIFPCGIHFEGENVIVGRSSLLQKRNKQLNIRFDDGSTSTYEYPSEMLLIEEYSFSHDEEVESLNNANIVTQSNTSVETVLNTKCDNSSSLSNNTSLNTLGGLASYIPSKFSDSEPFELGVSRPISLNPSSLMREEAPTTTTNDGIMLKPAEDDQVSSWSSSQTSETDLLF